MDIEYRVGGEPESTRTALARALFGEIQPEQLAPMRALVGNHYRSNKPGMQFVASTGQLVAFESRLEAFSLLRLDWEADVAVLAGQPFTLHFGAAHGRARHTPDFLARHHDGSVSVIDVKPYARLSDVKVKTQFELTENACAEMGWAYRVMTTPKPDFASNLNFLAGYRQAPRHTSSVLPHVRAAIADQPLPLGALTEQVGMDASLPSLLVRPVVFHALWTNTLVADLDHSLSHETRIAQHKGEPS